MNFRCLVVDDEELARELIASHLELIDGFEVFKTCATAIEARLVLQSEKVDLLFLDIEMPHLKGTDFVRSMSMLPPVIFTTAHRNFAIEAFELEAVDYLLKPITFERLFRSTEKFLKTKMAKLRDSPQLDYPWKEYIFMRINRKQVKIRLEEVLFIESIRDYVQIHMKSEIHKLKHGLTALHALLDNRFLRVHRSFIVNIDCVTAFTRHDVEIGNREISIGDNYREDVIANLQK